MIHFLPESFDQSTETQTPSDIGPYAEAVARLASIRQALACIEQFAGETPSDSMAEARLAAGWPSASPARQRVYDARSAKLASAAAAGLEMIASSQESGKEPHAAAIERLKRELGDGIGAIDQLFSL